MPGTAEEPIVPAAVAAVVVPAPVSETPAPQTGVTPAPVQADQVQAATPAPAEVTPPSPTGAEPAANEHPATLLDKFDEKKAEAAKPAAEPVKAEEAKPAEEKPVADPASPEVPATEPEPAPAPALEPIDYFAPEGGVKLPETLKMDDAQRGEFTTALEAYRAKPSVEGAQAILDMGAKAMEAHAKFLESEQWRVFREMGDANIKQVMADPVLGGAGHDTAMMKIATARNIIASDAPVGSDRYNQEVKEFNTALRVTGAGNMLPILRAFHNAAKYVREAQNLPPVDGKPPKDLGQKPKANGALRLNYDNPTSNPT